WVIKTGLLETQTVDFTLGSQGLRHTPGDIIEICDNDYAGTMTGGRILSIDAASRTRSTATRRSRMVSGAQSRG
ncbi:hypothetical protein F0C42_005260, partial [Escherichia coli O157:H7]|nr:hypothetical protein [Escherichia coli O157:H7]